MGNRTPLFTCVRALGTVETAAMHVGMDRTRRLEVYGTRGTAIHIQLGSNNLSLCLESGAEGYRERWQYLVIGPQPESPTFLRELPACVRGHKQPDYTLEHDIAVQRVLYAGCQITERRAMG